MLIGDRLGQSKLNLDDVQYFFTQRTSYKSIWQIVWENNGAFPTQSIFSSCASSSWVVVVLWRRQRSPHGLRWRTNKSWKCKDSALLGGCEEGEDEEVEVRRGFYATQVAPGARVVALALAGRRREEVERRGVCVCEGAAVQGSAWCHVYITEL